MGCLRNDYFIQLGPEKGVIHLATAAIVNALWDLWAKMENKVKTLTSSICKYPDI